MAMSDASSSPAEWTRQFYRRNIVAPRPSHPPVMFGSSLGPGDSTGAAVVAPTSSTSTTAAIEGRVSKPARRRTRASRRAPTTLLNTDTTNFRAMVQQFTGIPSGPPYTATSAYRPGGAPPAPAMINYGLSFGDPPLCQAANLQTQQQQQQQQLQGHRQPHQLQLQQQYLQANGSVDDAALQGFGEHAAGGGSNTQLDVGDGLYFEFDGMPSNHRMMPRAAAASTNNRINDGYFS